MDDINPRIVVEGVEVKHKWRGGHATLGVTVDTALRHTTASRDNPRPLHSTDNHQKVEDSIVHPLENSKINRYSGVITESKGAE